MPDGMRWDHALEMRAAVRGRGGWKENMKDERRLADVPLGFGGL